MLARTRSMGLSMRAWLADRGDRPGDRNRPSPPLRSQNADAPVHSLDSPCAASRFRPLHSGTTDGQGVVLSHQDILERIDAANQAGPSAEDKVVWILPMAFISLVPLSST